MAAREVTWIRGEGGAPLGIPHPLPPGIAERIRSGGIVVVDHEGQRVTPPVEPAEPVEVETLADKRTEELKAEEREAAKLREEPVVMPARSASTATWQKFAVSTGHITAEAAADLSRSELIERFGQDDTEGEVTE